MRLLAKLLGEAFARPGFEPRGLRFARPLGHESAGCILRSRSCSRRMREAGFEPEQDDRSRFARALRLAGFESAPAPSLVFSHFVRKLVQCAGPDSNRRTPTGQRPKRFVPFKCPLWRSRWRAPKITRDARSRCARALAGVWRTLASRGLACIAIVSPRTIK